MRHVTPAYILAYRARFAAARHRTCWAQAAAQPLAAAQQVVEEPEVTSMQAAGAAPQRCRCRPRWLRHQQAAATKRPATTFASWGSQLRSNSHEPACMTAAGYCSRAECIRKWCLRSTNGTILGVSGGPTCVLAGPLEAEWSLAAPKGPLRSSTGCAGESCPAAGAPATCPKPVGSIRH